MEIVNVRIDERLVHGMVASLWIPKLQVNRVICIDAESAANPTIKSALRMATPKQVFLSVIPLEKAIENLKAEKYGAERIMIVAKRPDIMLALVEAGVPVKELTIGNLGIIKKEADAVRMNQYVMITQEQKLQFEKLQKYGVEAKLQLIPDDVAVEFYSVMNSKM